MKAYITSIGESTTDLCKWALERQGFETVIIQNSSTLWQKIYDIINSETNDFLRIDADTIVNKNIQDLIKEKELWWYQTLTFDWWKQDIGHGGIQFIRREAIPIIKKHIFEARDKERPESYLFRLAEFHEPRVCGTYEQICGLHGYKQDDMKRVVMTKARRNQTGYDFELAMELNKL